MNSSRAATLIGALVFLAIAAAALYRLLFGYPISIGGAEQNTFRATPLAEMLLDLLPYQSYQLSGISGLSIASV